MALSGVTIVTSLIQIENLYARPSGIPVIMYHDISNLFNDSYTISPDSFAAQMEWLYSNGYNAVSIQEAGRIKRNDADRAVVITFDDGYASFMDFAFPLMQEYRFRVTINIIGQYVGSYVARNRPMLSWDEYRYLIKNDLVDLGCHTFNLHSMQKNVLTVSGEEIENDLLMFRTKYKEEIGRAVDILAWPYGRFNKRSMEIARKNGFKYILTSNGGIFHNDGDHYSIPRINIDSELDLLTFSQLVQKNNVTSKK